MTEKSYELREIEAPTHYRVETVYVTDCECGNTLRADAITECQQCGAHYEMSEDETEMIQTAPPSNDKKFSKSVPRS